MYELSKLSKKYSMVGFKKPSSIHVLAFLLPEILMKNSYLVSKTSSECGLLMIF